MAQNTPATPPHGIAATPPDRGPLRLLTLRLEPPMAMGDTGLACPRELSGYFPEPPNFFAGTFYNRSTHRQSIHETGNATAQNATLFPAFHGALSRSGNWPHNERLPLARRIVRLKPAARGASPAGFLAAFFCGS